MDRRMKSFLYTATLLAFVMVIVMLYMVAQSVLVMAVLAVAMYYVILKIIDMKEGSNG